MKVHVHLPGGDGCSIDVSPERTPISELNAEAHCERCGCEHGHGVEVVTWGLPEFGGDSQVQEQLRNARSLCFCCYS